MNEKKINFGKKYIFRYIEWKKRKEIKECFRYNSCKMNSVIVFDLHSNCVYIHFVLWYHSNSWFNLNSKIVV